MFFFSLILNSSSAIPPLEDKTLQNYSTKHHCVI